MKKKIVLPLATLWLPLAFPLDTLAQDYTNPGGSTDSYQVSSPPNPSDDRTGSYDSYTNLGQVTADGTDTDPGGTLTVNGAFVNEGTAITVGTGNDSSFGYGIFVWNGGFTNSGGGTITATGTGNNDGTGGGIFLAYDNGFTNSGSGAIIATGTATNEGYGGGIYVNQGGFVNSGSGVVTATGIGESGGSGAGIYIYEGDFINSGSGAVTATGIATGTGNSYSSEGTGIYIEDGGFINNGSSPLTITAIGADGGYGTGIYIGNGGFINNGSGMVTLLARSMDGGAAYGLDILAGGLTNSGQMTLAGQGSDAHAVALDGSATQNAVFSSGSTLYLAKGGSVSFLDYGSGTDGATNAIIEPGARLVSLEMSALNVGASYTHNVINNADRICTDATCATLVDSSGANGFTTASNAVFQYAHSVTQGLDSSNYAVTVTRLNDASTVTGGAAGTFLSGLEQYFRNNGDDPAGASVPWLALLTGVENAADVRAAGREVFRQASAQGTTQSIQALNRGQQVVTRQFRNNFLGSFSSLSLNRDPGDRTTVWGVPFHHNGTQDGNDLYTDLDQDFSGVDLGMTRWSGPNNWGELAFGAAFNYLNSDFEGRGYRAEADGYGFSLGLTARFNGNGQWHPRLALYGGWMAHDFDQRRNVAGLPSGNGTYWSNPDAKVWNLGLSLDNDCALNDLVIFKPRLALDYASTSLDGYTERGPAGSNLALTANADDYDSLRSDLGASLIWLVSSAVTLEGRADWYHEFGDTEATIMGRAANVPNLVLVTEGLDPNRDSGSVGAGLAWRPSAADKVLIKLDYDYHFGDGYSGHEVVGLVRVEF